MEKFKLKRLMGSSVVRLPPRPKMANATQNDLFSSLISEIKNYTGKDPLLPWLRGIKNMRESLPPQLLREKLPRFLQKCAQTFKADRCYRNDLRFVGVWIQLLNFVDDPRPLPKTMEMNQIGKKQALFYQAYGLYYEKLIKFEEAEKMYHLGVQNFAEPAVELQKSFEQFLHRMEQHKKRRTRRRDARAAMSSRVILSHDKETEQRNRNISSVKDSNILLPDERDHKIVETKLVMEEISLDKRGESDSKTCLSSNQLRNAINSPSTGIVCNPSGSKEVMGAPGPSSSLKQRDIAREPNGICNDETVVKFVDTAIIGKSEAEDACHHGLVEPTINLKEAMNAINSMFREPLELEPVHRRKSQRSRAQVNQRVSTGLEVFVDERLDNGTGLSSQNKENGDMTTASSFVHPAKSVPVKKHRTEAQMPLQETFKIFVDDEHGSDYDDENYGNDSLDIVHHPTEDSNPRVGTFVFPIPNDLQSSGSDGLKVRSSPNLKLGEDTVVGRFVGSAIFDDPEVENACHHGLVDPTINLKEAMDAINSMFGKPLDFVKMNRPKKLGKSIDKNRGHGGFSILPDEDFQTQQHPESSSHPTSRKASECDFFEPTVFTREAMDDINEMFGKPLD